MPETYPHIWLCKRLVQAKLFMDKNYMNPIDVNNIACEASFSRFHFIREFKKIYGKTPHRYLVGVRIQKAKEMLTQLSPVSDVCTAVGFESLGSFSLLFKKTVGLSPSHFLRIQKTRRQQMKEKPLAFVPGCYVTQHGYG